MSGGWFGAQPSHQTHTRFVASCRTALTIENNTAQVPVVDVTIPGGTLDTRNSIRISALCEYVNDTTAVNCYTIRAFYGTACQIATMGSAAVAQSCERSWIRFHTDIMAADATNAQRAFTKMDYTTTAASAAGTGRSGVNQISGHMGVVVDSTVDQTFRITTQLSSAVGCVKFVFHTLHVERIAGG